MEEDEDEGIEPLFPSRKRLGESRETRIRQIEVCPLEVRADAGVGDEKGADDRRGETRGRGRRLCCGWNKRERDRTKVE